MATIVHQQRRRVAHAGPGRRVQEPDEERPFWQVVALVYVGIFLLAVILTAACFLSAWLVVGRPY